MPAIAPLLRACARRPSCPHRSPCRPATTPKCGMSCSPSAPGRPCSRELRERAGDAEACVVGIVEVAARGIGLDAGGGAQELGHIAPRAAAQDPARAVAFLPGAAVGGRADIALVP